MSPFTAWVLVKSFRTLDCVTGRQHRSLQWLEADEQWLVITPVARRRPRADLARRQMTGGGCVNDLHAERRQRPQLSAR